MIPVLDPDPESDLQLFGDSGSGFGSSKKQRPNSRETKPTENPTEKPIETPLEIPYTKKKSKNG